MRLTRGNFLLSAHITSDSNNNDRLHCYCLSQVKQITILIILSRFAALNF